ncbi:CDP-6-deoxy-delta-3,4-glucoseen reductase [Propionivibrio sp.]|uniref:CDP-6-deoxy-delta-3,4-glucoseen reductase n=1 Tax=Propionivibrio sp. TaxID=2212460 RepID=UPI003BF194E5
MGFQISVQPSNHVFQAEAEETILDAALRQGLALPYGCRYGACGACRGKVLSGQVDHGKALNEVLSEADRRAGFALFCCASASSDLSIESRELRSSEELPVKTLPARVQKLTRAAPDVMLVELRLPASERLQFFAGQYIDILLKGGRRRAFSLANAPHDDGCLQLHIRHVPGGQFTDHVFSTMKDRDMLRFNGPHGSFYLREDSQKPMLLVAGGTGFAPIKAIVEHAIAEKTTRAITLYWGGRERADLYLLPLAEQWAREQPGMRFVPVLSDTPQCEKWSGRIGFVHAAAMQDFPDLSGHQVYVCGSPAMVAAARRDFVGQCQLPENEFFADSFEYAIDEASEAVSEAATVVQNPSNIAG